MTNANDSIVPITYKQTGDHEKRVASAKDIQQSMYLIHTEGLTKREHFAAMALQGMYSNQGLVDQWNCEDTMALNAVKAADALIKALNETNE